VNKVDAFQQFLVSTDVPISLATFLVDLILAALLGMILGAAYRRYGRALSNRGEFARNFVLLTTTTMFIITIVKSSLALSLGLVGALSIVRFRAAIKEPEELTYLFFAISIGLGLGAGQRNVTLGAFLMILLFLIAKGLRARRHDARNLFLSVTGRKSAEGGPDAVLEVLRKQTVAAKLIRLDETPTEFDLSLDVDFEGYANFEAARAKILGLPGDLRLSLIDNRGLVD